MMTRAPIRVPAKTIAPVEMMVPSPISAGGSGSRFAVERGESDGCLPTTAPSRIFTPSPRAVPGWTTALGWISGTKRLRETVERPDDAGAVLGDLAPVALAADEAQELLALELERLVGGDLRDGDVAGARLPLAVAVRPLPRRLLVDGHLALELHVVEHDHLLAADDRDPAHLVRVEPRQVHVRDLPAREAQVAEHDVLDAFGEEVAAVRDAELRLLV